MVSIGFKVSTSVGQLSQKPLIVPLVSLWKFMGMKLYNTQVNRSTSFQPSKN